MLSEIKDDGLNEVGSMLDKSVVDSALVKATIIFVNEKEVLKRKEKLNKHALQRTHELK